MSPAANLEDVVLARALAAVPSPRALLVGDPSSRLAGALRGLLDAGWTCAFRSDVDAPVDDSADRSTLHVALLTDPTVPGRTSELVRLTPWVVVVDSPLLGTAHAPWQDELDAAGYGLAHADGLSRYYVADEHEDLRDALSYPAGPRDAYVTEEVVRLRRQVDALTDEVVRWRAAALERWAATPLPDVVNDTHAQALERELAAVRQTLSWRITAPLRAVRGRGGR